MWIYTQIRSSHKTESNSIDDDFIPDEDNASTDESDYSEPEAKDEEEHLVIGDWTYLSDIFGDRKPADPKAIDCEYDLHPALEFDEQKDVKKSKHSGTVTMCPHFTAGQMNRHTGTSKTKVWLKVHLLKWKDVCRDEMYVFLSFLLLTGIVKCTNLHGYWSNDVLSAGPGVFTATFMSRNRLTYILKLLRFSKPSAVPDGIPNKRLAMFIAMFREICQILADHGKIFAVDECFVLIKDSLDFRKYIKIKKSRFGKNLFSMCTSDSKLRGYTSNICLYTGKTTYDFSHTYGTEDLLMSEKIPIFLAKNLLGHGREILLDNWYNWFSQFPYAITAVDPVLLCTKRRDTRCPS